MYSYYTLSLLKISCPWKRYLTQAQLLQFTSVVVYSLFSGKMVYDKEGFSEHFISLCMQVFEMVSLFVLFMRFYSKAYSKKKVSAKKASSGDSDTASESVPEQDSVSSDGSSDAKKNS